MYAAHCIRLFMERCLLNYERYRSILEALRKGWTEKSRLDTTIRDLNHEFAMSVPQWTISPRACVLHGAHKHNCKHHLGIHYALPVTYFANLLAEIVPTPMILLLWKLVTTKQTRVPLPGQPNQAITTRYPLRAWLTKAKSPWAKWSVQAINTVRGWLRKYIC